MFYRILRYWDQKGNRKIEEQNRSRKDTKVRNSGASSTQQRRTPCYGVALCSNVEALRRSELGSRFFRASGTPRLSKVSLSKTGVLQTLIFWAIDGPVSRGIKWKEFRGRKGDSEIKERTYKQRKIDTDGFRERSRRRLFL